MDLLATVLATLGRRDDNDEYDVTAGEKKADAHNRRGRCRNCGRYYDLPAAACPHCGSGNTLRGGAPSGQTRSR